MSDDGFGSAKHFIPLPHTGNTDKNSYLAAVGGGWLFETKIIFVVLENILDDIVFFSQFLDAFLKFFFYGHAIKTGGGGQLLRKKMYLTF